MRPSSPPPHAPRPLTAPLIEEVGATSHADSPGSSPIDRKEAPIRARQGDAIGVYVHFPWCLSKCPYCDFVVVAAPRESIDRSGYTRAILAELAQRRQGLEQRRLSSIFFGGGTPSLWGAREVGSVIQAITASFRVTDPVEITLECDPSSFDEDLGRALVDEGVTRVSIGVQSLSDERLRFLGRIHSSEEAVVAVRGAVAARVPRVSADFMYAFAGLTPEAAARESSELAHLGATHVSAYSLTIESGTPFGQLARKGRLPLCDDAVMAESFFAIDDALEGLGFRHYEISNYAKPGEESRHNLGYWLGRDYLGLGCGAYGTVTTKGGGALRYRNHATPKSYLKSLASSEETLAADPDAPRPHVATDGRHAAFGTTTPTKTEEILDGPTRLRERIMLGLRTRDGFHLEAAAAELGTDAYPGERRHAIDRLQRQGRLQQRDGHLSVPREAWIWVDDTAARLF